MQSWRLLQLEPSALREPDEFTAPTRLGNNGTHLASTLYHLARGRVAPYSNAIRDDTQVYAQIANRLTELIDDVREVGVDVDRQRELLSVFARGKDGTAHPARALSDGTLRFLALAVIERDPTAQGVLCLEEPENGIHPDRVPAMLSLIQEIATDTDLPVGTDNPLRQVIINTHSPIVVGVVRANDLIVAQLKETVQTGRGFRRVSFACLPDTWRATDSEEVVALGKLLAYLSPVESRSVVTAQNGQTRIRGVTAQSTVPVAQREDVQRLLHFGEDE